MKIYIVTGYKHKTKDLIYAICGTYEIAKRELAKAKNNEDLENYHFTILENNMITE